MEAMTGETFARAYARLNAAQKEAVDTIDGPVLVIAGPGTGKTQLLSARVANILDKTDTDARNILCLTFTESGAANMRERLTRFIGQRAYNVGISTYHAFGDELLRRFPEYFAETRLQTAVDELGKRQILSDIVDGLSYKNPLKQARHHLGDLIGTISEVKRALLDRDALRAIAKENTQFIAHANVSVQEIFAGFTRMPSGASGLAKVAPLFEQTLLVLRQLTPEQPVNTQFGSLAAIAARELQEALDEATASSKTTPLTTWKNNWLAKNADNQLIFDGELENQRINALADVFDQYQTALETRGWYDFDDMIIRAVDALEKNADLRFTLQEQYLYLLLDEFQDTNAAQLKLVELLTDNPVNEGRPNVLAVGDDDQAIYAFQGAQYSNMLDFYQMYRDVRVINLTQNYRSHADILHAARGVAEQIEARLHHHFQNMSKTLEAANRELPPDAHVQRREFLSDIAQYDWMAHEIKQLIDGGTSPSDIAVLAPKHKYLEPLVPYLNALDIPVRYEKRENILEAPVVRQLITMSKLVLALHKQDETVADALWPEVLSFDFWQLPLSAIWQLSWKVNDARGDGKLSWSRALLESEQFRLPALLMLGCASKVATTSCELILDYLIGTEELKLHEPEHDIVRSPLRPFYTSAEMQTSQPELFYTTLSHLTVLRAKLRDYQATQDTALTLPDLIKFVGLYEAAELQMQSTSPYNQQAEAVQLMTVFKAKGLEFAHVFLPSCHDDVWGSSGRGNSNKLTLPPNLAPIRHAGATEDERLRIFFVALTRAKVGLHLTSYAQGYNGKATKRLKYLDEREQEDGNFKSEILPGKSSIVQQADHQPPSLESLELDWRSRHVAGIATVQLRDLLAARLKNYQLSPTDLNCFVDLEYGGPEQFFFQALLRFPGTPTPDSQFGDAIHDTLEWLQHRVDEQKSLPPLDKTLAYFAAQVRSKKLLEAQSTLLIERGEHALRTYLQQRGTRFKPGDKAEQRFRNEGVFVGAAHLTGKIDRMEIDHEAKTITVVDYKTGKPYAKWAADAKLHKYRQQLYCYKILIEQSDTFKNYTVQSGRLEFVEPEQGTGRICALELNFEDAELARLRQLIQAVWQRIMSLDFPDIAAYASSLTGIKQFEQDLIEGKPHE